MKYSGRVTITTGADEILVVPDEVMRLFAFANLPDPQVGMPRVPIEDLRQLKQFILAVTNDSPLAAAIAELLEVQPS